MDYLIDGYNLLHHVGLLQGKVGPQKLERARMALLGRVSGFYKDQAAHVTVVFDANHAPADVAPEQVYLGVHVYFAVHEEADDVIERLIRRSSAPQNLTVVSNDRRLRDAARRRHCPLLECVDFWEMLEKRPLPEASALPRESKPEQLSERELQHWMREFADLQDENDEWML